MKPYLKCDMKTPPNNRLQPPPTSAFRMAPAWIRWLVPLVGAAVISACSSYQTSSTIPKNLSRSEPGALAPGDIVKVTFPGAADMNTTAKVSADGKLNLPLIGEVAAAGKRLGSFQEEVDNLYKPQLTNNLVAVSLDASSLPVYVTGAVTHPGKIILERPMTVLEAIMEAGGTSDLGSLKGVVVIRSGNGEHFSQAFDLSPTLKGRTAQAFYVKAYDTVYVPERLF